MKTAIERVDWILGEVIRRFQEQVDAPGSVGVNRREMVRAVIGVLKAMRADIVDVLMGREDGGDH